MGNEWASSLWEVWMFKKCRWIWCDVNKWKKSEGYFLEVDLEYSDKLHDLHNNCPLAPEKIAVSSDMF